MERVKCYQTFYLIANAVTYDLETLAIMQLDTSQIENQEVACLITKSINIPMPYSILICHEAKWYLQINFCQDPIRDH